MRVPSKGLAPLLSAAGVLVALGCVSVFARPLFSNDTDSAVSCEEAFDFLMAEAPAQATEAQCRSYGVMDRSYRISFQLPSAELDPWVVASFPDRQPLGPGPYSHVDVARDPQAATAKGAYAITLDARPHDGGTTLVSIEATDY
ncbi:hypothetical protein ACFCXT_01130 [Streptomyces vinaceus]|uniref:hypothetical protein n=1 Tax=Streptomyces vinaceus TaxID=1960 RepID=UPI0035DDD776